MAPPRVWTRGRRLLLAVVLSQLGALSCHCQTLRGSVSCLDCAPGHDLSGVVVAVECGGGVDGAGAHIMARTDGGGNFGVAVPAAASRCAARVLGGKEQLCAPRRLTVACVVAGRPGAYALGSRLAVFTRCGGGVGAVATMSTGGDSGQRSPPTARPPPRLPSPSLPPLVGRGSPPYGLGIPLIYVFPFIPIIGIP